VPNNNLKQTLLCLKVFVTITYLLNL